MEVQSGHRASARGVPVIDDQLLTCDIAHNVLIARCPRRKRPHAGNLNHVCEFEFDIKFPYATVGGHPELICVQLLPRPDGEGLFLLWPGPGAEDCAIRNT